MPKVLRIINRLNLGGPTFNAGNLTAYMSDDFETMLVAGVKDESEESSEFILEELNLKPILIPNMRRELNPRKDWEVFWKLVKIIKEFKPDIVHTHAAKAGTLGRLAASYCGVKVILHTFHGHVFHSYFSPLKTKLFLEIERFLARKSSAIIAISPLQKRELVEDFKICPDEKMRIVHLGFKLAKFTEDKDNKRKQFRTNYQLEEDEIAIGIIGRLVPVKNHKLFIDSIKILSEEKKNKIKAFIVGDGELKEELTSYCREQGVDYCENEGKATINFTSWIKEIDMVNAGLDIMALTSLNEGTPVTLIEAQASGLPIVSTNVGGISDITSEGITSLLSPSGDVNAYTKNLRTLIEDKDKRTSMGNAGPDMALKQFSYQRLCKDMEELYYELLSQK